MPLPRLAVRASRSRLSVPLVAAGVVLTLAVDTFLVSGARRADPVTAGEAVARFRAAREFAGLPGWDRPLTGERPLAGVYTYTTKGYAKVDLLGVRRDYPAETVRVVTHGPGCQWRETVPIFAEHTETYSACAVGGDQLDTGFGTRLGYFLVSYVTDLVCDPPGSRIAGGLAEGASRTFRCADEEHDVRVDGTVTYLGRGTAPVIGILLPCRRIRILTVLSGRNEGAANRELCVEPTFGLALTETRNVGISARTFLGTVRYVEEATFSLAQVTPRV